MNKLLAVERESIFLHRDPIGGTWRGASLLGTLRERCNFVFIRGCVKEGSGNGHLFIGAPMGNVEGAHFPGTLRDK
jgi:hypothetical protein